MLVRATLVRHVGAWAAILAVHVLVLGHAVHEHPHHTDREVACTVCATPLADAATVPTLVPPAPAAITAATVAPAAPATRRVPLSFSPKQSPPA